MEKDVGSRLPQVELLGENKKEEEEEMTQRREAAQEKDSAMPKEEEADEVQQEEEREEEEEEEEEEGGGEEAGGRRRGAPEGSRGEAGRQGEGCGGVWAEAMVRACEVGDYMAVSALLERKGPGIADVREPLDARTPLHAAVLAAHPGIVELLLSSCPDLDVNRQDRGGATPLHLAVQFASDEVIQILIDDQRTDVNLGDKMNTTPLILAAHRGRKNVAKWLIEREAKVNAYTIIGTTALHSAVEQGHVDIVAYLLDKDAEVNRQDSAGFTPLCLAVQAGNMAMVALLVRSGASITLQDQYGRTPLDLAISEEMQALLKECLDFERSKQLNSFARKSITLVTSDTDPLCIDFLPIDPSLLAQGPATRARIGICCCPGRNKRKHRRDIFKDIAALAAVDADVLVTLVREVELQKMGATQLVARSQEQGIESVWAPITDKWLPESMEFLVSLVELLLNRLQEDKVLVVHCNGGKGRSGMVVVSVLVALGMKVGDAIDLVRAARPGTIRNPAQIFYVKLFRQIWHQNHAPGLLRDNPPPLPLSTAEYGSRPEAVETQERRKTSCEGKRRDTLGRMLASLAPSLKRDKAGH